jgi:hypothetical protein
MKRFRLPADAKFPALPAGAVPCRVAIFYSDPHEPAIRGVGLSLPDEAKILNIKDAILLESPDIIVLDENEVLDSITLNVHRQLNPHEPPKE